MEQVEQKEHKDKNDSNNGIVRTDAVWENHSDTVCQMIKELVQEEKECNPENIFSVAKMAEANLDQLRIQMNQEGIKSHICGKMKGKRGRKSLKELREVDGHNKEQKKMIRFSILGRGSAFPKSNEDHDMEC